MEKQITIKDVADYAGVSYMTVSRILRGSSRHSEHTKRKVLQAAQELGYQPNALAKAFRTKKTGIVGLVIRKRSSRTVRSDIFYSQIIEGIESELLVHDYNVLLSSIDSEQIEDFELPSALNKGLLDGILILGVSERKYLSWLYEKCPQLVVVDESPEDIPCVFSANFRGGRLAGEYLYNKGHRNFAMALGYWNDYNFEARLSGFSAFLESKHDAKLHILRTGPSEQDRVSAIEKFLEVNPDISAIFCANDGFAFDIIRGIHNVGYKVPNDIAVVGYDNIETYSRVRPSLTTVAVNKEQMGAQAARLLIKLINGKSVDENENANKHKQTDENFRIEIPVRLIERESS